MISITNVADEILCRGKNLDDESIAELDKTLVRCNKLIELIEKLVQSKSGSLQQLLEPVVDEIFLDFHLTLILAMSSEFKASLVLARTCFESLLYVIFFTDHPIEARMWSNSNKDMSFSETLEILVNPSYFEAACNKKFNQLELQDFQTKLNCIKKNLANIYRNLSERVHGKYSFLQNVELTKTIDSTDKSLRESFHGLINLAIDSFATLIALRMEIDQKSIEEIHSSLNL